MSVTRLGRIGLLFLLGLGLVLLLPVAPAQADAGHVVISEVYTRGGESGALYNADYAELYNPTPDAVDLNGWSLQGRAPRSRSAPSGPRWRAWSWPLGSTCSWPHLQGPTASRCRSRRIS